MKFTLRTVEIAFVVILIVALALTISRTSSPTTLAIRQSEEQTYAHTLNDRITTFFEVYALDFPRATCTNVVEELYTTLAYLPTEITGGYRTHSKERIATINFGVEPLEALGTADLIKGTSLIGDKDDSFISINAQSVMRLARENRYTFLKMNLYGTSKELFTIKHGTFSTPSLDCSFTAEDGIAECECKAHSIEGVVTD